MLRVVTDNDNLSTVDRLQYSRVGLNDREADAILDAFGAAAIIPIDAQFRPVITETDELNLEARPALKKFLRGPFTLSVSNQGERMDKAMLVFELHHSGDPLEDDPSVEKTDFGLYITGKMGIIPNAIAAIPFVDAFRREIVKEASRAERLLKTAKVQSLDEVRDRPDEALIRTMTTNFMAIVRPDQDGDATTRIAVGKEAVCDMLAGSLVADHDFYDGLWDRMNGFFEPAIRFLGEEHALGRTDLESPGIIHS